ncbi:hypothetical protein ACFV1R_37035, partial [Streptomyces coelicoflavus]
DLDRAAPDVARATAAWQRLWDEGQVATRGQELLHMWERLSAAGLLHEPSHHAMAEAVRSRLAQGDRSLPPQSPPAAAAAALTAGPGQAPAPVAPEDKPLKPARRGLRRFTRRAGRSPGPSS